MHQGLTTKILICTVLLLAQQAYGQLNNSSEIIETIDDIQIHDDTGSKKEENPNKPKFDEEFGKQQSVKDEAPSEENVVEPESPQDQYEEVEEEAVNRKQLNDDNQPSYEDELEKNARKNRFERKEISPEDMKSFEVDPAELAEPAKPAQKTEPVVGTPQEPQPAEPVELQDEIEQEISEMPEETPEEESTVSKPTEITPESKPGPTIYYPPEKSGPVISYKNEKKLSDEQIKNLSEKTKVEIEDDPFVEGTLSKKIGDYLKPYKDRRPSWTNEISLGVNQFVPINYLSDINPGEDFDVFYEDSDIPSPELSFEFKKNFSWASISLGGGASFYSTSNDVADFTLIMPSLKVTLYLDTLFDEPYIVPYGSLGYAYMMYDEAPVDGSEGFKGETDNIYAGFGVLFQLDWLDPVSDALAYTDVGIENTFVYVEGRTYLDQGFMRAEDDPDFSTSTHIAGGVKLEF